MGDMEKVDIYKPKNLGRSTSDNASRHHAAAKIQRMWRSRRQNYMNTEVRWQDAATHAEQKVSRSHQSERLLNSVFA